MRQGFDTAHFDDIYDIAADGYGTITAKQARGKGLVPPVNMKDWKGSRHDAA